LSLLSPIVDFISRTIRRGRCARPSDHNDKAVDGSTAKGGHRKGSGAEDRPRSLRTSLVQAIPVGKSSARSKGGPTIAPTCANAQRKCAELAKLPTKVKVSAGDYCSGTLNKCDLYVMYIDFAAESTQIAWLLN